MKASSPVFRSLRGRLFLLVFIPVILAGAYIADILVHGNFQPITEGEAYRSGQLNGARLEHYLKEYRIKSVLNLRGDNSGADWYEDEIATCKRLSAQKQLSLRYGHFPIGQTSVLDDFFKEWDPSQVRSANAK